MKLIGNLKRQVENEGTMEGRKRLIEKAGMKLTDEELDNVSGGVDPCTPTGHGRGEFDSQIEPHLDRGGEDGSESGPVTYIHS